MGDNASAASIQSLWHRYVSPPGSSPSTDYGLAYPQPLIEALAGYIVDGCRQLGIRGFGEIAGHPNDIGALIAEAWDRFLADPDAFGASEQARLAALWNELGC